MQSVFKRKTVGILAAVGAVALFAGGGALGYALNTDNSTETVKRIYVPATGQLPGNETSGSGANPAVSYPVIGPKINTGAEMAADSDMVSRIGYPGPGYYGLCPMPLGNVASGSIVDITNSGFVMNLLGEGFELRGINIRSEGECGPNGEPPATGFMVVDTNWVHTASGYDVYLSQRVSPDAQANVRYAESANFWADGYLYTVSVSNWPMYPMLERSGVEIVPPPAIDDPQVQAILDAAIGQLVPQIGAQCFFTLEKGFWGDLSGLGVGDPRPALPSGFTENHSNIDRFVAPAADCPGADLEPVLNTGVYAGFSDNAGGWIDISVWPQYENVTWPGYIDETSASWSNGQWSYNVYGYGNNGGLGRATIEAIARAMDPNFNDACFIQTNELTDPASVGLGTVTAPDGYTITNTRHTATDVPANCSVDAEGYPNYNLNWTVENGDNTYEVNANHYPASEGFGGEKYGYISDWGMSWGTEGANYSIWANSRGVTGTPDREAMVAIAQSLDPTLDVTTLEEEKGGGMPRPLPVEPDGGIGDGAGSEGSSGSSEGRTTPSN